MKNSKKSFKVEVIEDGEFKVYRVLEPFKEDEIWKDYTEIVKSWFYSKFIELTPPQKYSFKLIKLGLNVLITAPTGSGKTLSAFLAIIDNLLKLALENRLEDYVYAVYISPLRALNNDIRRNLEIPLKEIYELAKKKNINLQEIRVAVRTSDTTPYEKQKQLKKPPHILITTPESLAIVLNAPKFREKLSKVRYIIVDEIHELASSKRGTHLILSLERLSNYVVEQSKLDPQRIGLSATIHPLEEVAKFLVGKHRKIYIVDTTAEKKFDIKVLFPTKNIFYTQQELEKDLYDLLEKIIRNHRTTLIFTNTRHGTESVVWKLKERLKDLKDKIEAHHSSLSREIRLEVEEKLKKGMLKAVVCLPPHSKILTDRGEIEVKNLDSKNIYGFDLKNKKLVIQNLKDVIKIKGKFLGYRVLLSDNSEFVATRDHKVLVLENNKLIFKRLEDLKPGDKIVRIKLKKV